MKSLKKISTLGNHNFQTMQAENIRSLIIDDDPFIQELLKDKLNQYFPEVEVMTTASSGKEGLQNIASYKPDLIFLDVEMADMTGFDDPFHFSRVFKKFKGISPSEVRSISG